MTTASTKTVKELHSQIERKRVKSSSGQWFIPQATVRNIFSPDIIKDAVAELTCAPQDRLGLVDDIHRRGTITFAILVWMGRADSIVRFRTCECLDNQLPLLSEARAQEVSPEFGLSFVREYQWQFLPYTFEENMHYREIPDEVILPFVREEHVTDGGFGKISKLWIPFSMQNFPGMSANTVRAKYLKRLYHLADSSYVARDGGGNKKTAQAPASSVSGRVQ
jgi:hypothetical protein